MRRVQAACAGAATGGEFVLAQTALGFMDLGLDFDAVCTGHYARIVDGPSGRALHRAVDPAKDQSYVLAVLDDNDYRLAVQAAEQQGAPHPESDHRPIMASRRGLRVSNIDVVDHLDLIETRRGLETLIATCSARRASTPSTSTCGAASSGPSSAGRD